jgi:hypothetical protein
MSKWSEKLVAETRKRLGYLPTVKPHPLDIDIADAARKQTLLECIAICDKHENECDKSSASSLCHAHDSEEIARLLDEGE